MDHLTRSMDTWEISLVFKDVEHSGDRRKQSQQCSLTQLINIYFSLPTIYFLAKPKGLSVVNINYKQYPKNPFATPFLHSAGMAGMATHANSPWPRSRALRGTLSGVERARVQDLQNPDPEKALAPHWRVPKIQIWINLLFFSTKLFHQVWPMRFNKVRLHL